jgi:CheY-like chemotaxis protein
MSFSIVFSALIRQQVRKKLFDLPGFSFTLESPANGLAKGTSTMHAKVSKPSPRTLVVARVLLVDDDPSARLTLKAVLEAVGYRVDAAASAAEAVGKLDERQYELVLSDLQMESPKAGLKVLAHARLMNYKPATALLTTERSDMSAGSPVLVEPEDLPGFMSQVADLISQRAARLVDRELRSSVAG